MCPGTLEIIFFLGQNCQHKIKALTSFCQNVELPNNRVWGGWAGSVDKSRCISNSSRHKNFSYLGMEIVLPSSHSKQPKFRGKNTWEPSLVWDWILDCYGDHFIIGPTTHMEQNSSLYNISFETVKSTNVNVEFISLMNDGPCYRASALCMSENVL